MDGVNEKLGDIFQANLASTDDLPTITVSSLTKDEGESNENAKNKNELIIASNSSKKEESMTSKVQTKAKANRKVPAKKKAATASSKSKIQTKFKFKEEVGDSDLEGSSSDENFLEEFGSGDSDFSSSTDSDDLSQEFSDEDRLMEYYEKKLREHSIVGNFNYNSELLGLLTSMDADMHYRLPKTASVGAGQRSSRSLQKGNDADFSEDSEPSQELKKLVDDTFKPKPSGKGNQVYEATTKLAKKATNANRAQARIGKTSGNSQPANDKGAAQKSTHTVKVNMKSVISGLKSEKGAGKETVSKNVQVPKLPTSVSKKPSKKVSSSSLSQEKARKPIKGLTSRGTTPLDLMKTGSDGIRSRAVRRTSSTPMNTARAAQPNIDRASEGSGSYQKVVDYLARIKQVQNSISEINRKIKADSENAVGQEIVKSARAAILEQRDRSRKPPVKQNVKDVSVSTSASSTASDGDSAFGEKQAKDEVVDRILNATLGVS